MTSIHPVPETRRFAFAARLSVTTTPSAARNTRSPSSYSLINNNIIGIHLGNLFLHRCRASYLLLLAWRIHGGAYAQTTNIYRLLNDICRHRQCAWPRRGRLWRTRTRRAREISYRFILLLLPFNIL